MLAKVNAVSDGAFSTLVLIGIKRALSSVLELYVLSFLDSSISNSQLEKHAAFRKLISKSLYPFLHLGCFIEHLT